MTFSEEQLEWIVAEVIRRLGVCECKNDEAPSSANELRLSEQVITMWSVEAKLSGVQRLVVPLRAVVTPAVKDELKMRHVELVREAKT